MRTECSLKVKPWGEIFLKLRATPRDKPCGRLDQILQGINNHYIGPSSSSSKDIGMVSNAVKYLRCQLRSCSFLSRLHILCTKMAEWNCLYSVNKHYNFPFHTSLERIWNDISVKCNITLAHTCLSGLYANMKLALICWVLTGITTLLPH